MKKIAELSPEDISCCKYAPVACTGRRNEFSRVFSPIAPRDNRRRFQFDNLKNTFKATQYPLIPQSLPASTSK